MLFILGAIASLMGVAYFLAALLPSAGRLVQIVILLLVFVMVIASLLTIAERKWSAMMQDRIGPNRARIDLPILRDSALGGVPHLAADALKMLFKEDFVPKRANGFLFNLAPILAFGPVFALFAIVPVGPSVRVLDRVVPMVIATPDFGVLFLFAIASLAVYGTSLAGWSSNNKLALLGGVRAASQMISYEVALGLAMVGMMVAFSTVQLPELVDGQARYLWQFSRRFDLGLPAWGIFLQPVGFVLFFTAAFAETKRTPFDLPEGDSEIIGYFVEYSGMKFGMFMISEFIEVVVLSAVSTAIFFGGYHLPIGEGWLARRGLIANHPWILGVILSTVFWIKVVVLCWLQLAIRWTFPRFRYDQVQALGWKMLLPLGLLNVFISGALVLWDPSLRALAVVGLLEIGIVAALTVRGEGHPSKIDSAAGSSPSVPALTGASTTVQYPEERVAYPPGYRGLHRLVPREDGKPRCVACYMCATVCPAQCIYIEAGEYDPADSSAASRVIEKFPTTFVIDELRCIVCGLCVEACPKDAIRMDTATHAPSEYTRQGFVYDIPKLLNGPPVSHSSDPWKRRESSEAPEHQALEPHTRIGET